MTILSAFLEKGRALASRAQASDVASFVFLAEVLGAHGLARAIERAELSAQRLAPLHGFLDQCEAAGSVLDAAGVVQRIAPRPPLVRAGVTVGAGPGSGALSTLDSRLSTSSGAGMGAALPAEAWRGITLPAELVQGFFDETRERIDRVEERLLALEQNPTSRDDLDALFRDVHTLKGGAALAGVSPLNRLAHRAEDLLGELRSSGRAFTPELNDLLLAVADRFRAMLKRLTDGQDPTMDVGYLMSQLENARSGREEKKRETTEAQNAEAQSRDGGQAGKVSVAAGAVPLPVTAPGKVDGAGGVTVGAETIRIPFSKIDELFGIVGGIVLARSNADTHVADIAELHRQLETKLRQLGVGALGRSLDVRLREALSEAERQLRQHQLSGKTFSWARGFEELSRIFVEATRGLSREVNDAVRRMMELVETVMRSETESARSLKIDLTKIGRANADLEQHVMKLRMIPIGRLLGKFHRTVRDVSRELGKKVELVIEGQDTELDKILVDALDEPLLHVVRNAVDHGLEAPPERARAGKGEMGRLTLRAYGRGDQVIIEAEDDGRGIDTERVLKRARERGLVGADEMLEPRAVFDLLFRPGFSTAEMVTNLSGRGVGLDVVRTAIERMKGTIEIDSHMGSGTTFRIRLPLTLAVVPALFLRVGMERVALPLSVVRRSLQATEQSVQRVGTSELVAFGDVEIPLVRVGEVLGVGLSTPDSRLSTSSEAATFPVLWVDTPVGPVGLAFDAIAGKGDVIVKSVGGVLKHLPFVSGAAPLGEKAILVLDAYALSRAGRAA
jgi:two-component system chemotaxis sensor kinase CheA